jgi:hypothetical protein
MYTWWGSMFSNGIFDFLFGVGVLCLLGGIGGGIDKHGFKVVEINHYYDRKDT